MTIERLDIQSRGRVISVSTTQVDGRVVVVTGRRMRTAAFFDEELSEESTPAAPQVFVSKLKASGLRADVFTFSERLPDTQPRHPYRTEWDSLAVIPITTYAEWLSKRVEYDVRKAVKRAARDGVQVRVAAYDDEFVRGIARIYNETPFRQGRRFWHYGKDFETVKRENSTYADRCEYIGAYLGDELIGFIRMVYVRNAALTLQVISLRSHFARKPVNALIAKAVEVCEAKRLSYLAYGRYVYNDVPDSLTEFKRRNGFEEMRLPRYYVPLTAQGRIALALDLHRPIASRLPATLRAHLLRLRSAWAEGRAAAIAGRPHAQPLERSR
jgi:hypothetical protein